MEIKKTTVKAKTRKLNARWTVESQEDARVEHGMAWPTFEGPSAPQRKKGFTNSVFKAIFDELWYRFKLWKHNRKYIDVEKEITAALANEIAAEIDKEILADLKKTMQVPNKLLGNKR